MIAIKDWSLRSKVLIAASVAIASGFAVTLVLIGSNVYQSARETGLQRAKDQADAYAQQVEGVLKNGFLIAHDLVNTAQGLQANNAADRKTMDQIILQKLNAFRDGIGLWMLWEPNAFDGKDDEFRLDWPIYDPTGRYMPYMTRAGETAKQDTMNGPDQQAKFEAFRDHPQDYKPPYEFEPGWGDFYIVPKKRGKDTITDPFPYDVQGKTVIESSFAVPIRNKEGKFQGVGAVDMSLEQLQKLVGSYHPMGTGFVTLVSQGGFYAVSPDAKELGKAVAKGALPAGTMDAIANSKGLEAEINDQLHVWRPVRAGESGQNWALGVHIPMSTILENARSTRNQAILVGSLAGLAILAVLAVLLSRLTRPLTVLANAMEGLTEGHGDLTRRLKIESGDEIGRTAKAFNKLMDSLHGMFVDVRQQSQSVGEAAARLHQSAQMVRSASTHQAEAATATAASVEEVTVSIQYIADTVRDFEASAAETGKATSAGEGLVREMAHEISQINNSINAMADTMSKLGVQSQQVDTIVQVIKDIAEQTNLLALNAAIEAARAGEMGRGFAVVADEVRKLAARTAQATIEIGTIVSGIRTEIEAASTSMGNTRQQVNQGVTLSDKAADAISQVHGETGRLISGVSDIANATKEQAAASTDIAQNIERISSMVQNNSATVDDVANSVEQLEALSASLQAIIGRFKL
ncbi:methyl-accepting chemotaxis protein [Leeia oryzae]|uniref:methyl-accepting chemotaxis protein n=1 Tax=Leeia oryzae TaxID=356662 RepID=UPI0003608DE4|nr:methyl-accepting chemotaxis protein [Leeia oryzae]